ncbi:MAG TPA: hypothetical protein VII38_00595 [Polyangia bacterium]
MATTRERYRPSGFFRAKALLLFVAATAAGVALAWIYQFLLREIPFIYINLLVVCGFGAALAAGAWFAVQKGHCRNRVIALLLALPLAAVPLAASHWFEYRHVISAIVEKTPGASEADALREIPFGKYLEIKKQAGWKLESSTISGAAVTAIWIVEALIVFGAVLFGALAGVDEPYCEKCNRWCEAVAFRLHGVGRAEAEPVLSGGDLGALADLKAPTPPDPSLSVEIQIKRCGGCAETGFVSVSEKRMVQKKKKVEEKSKRLARHALLRPAERQRLLDRFSGLAGQKLPAA